MRACVHACVCVGGGSGGGDSYKCACTVVVVKPCRVGSTRGTYGGNMWYAMSVYVNVDDDGVSVGVGEWLVAGDSVAAF